MLYTLMPVLAATVAPALILLAVAYALRGQSGRHTAGLLVRRPAGWSPYDGRVREAIAYYAGREHERLELAR